MKRPKTTLRTGPALTRPLKREQEPAVNSSIQSSLLLLSLVMKSMIMTRAVASWHSDDAVNGNATAQVTAMVTMTTT